MWKTSQTMPDNVEIMKETAEGNNIRIDYAMRFAKTHDGSSYKYFEKEDSVSISKRLKPLSMQILTAMYNKMKASVEEGL